MISIETAITLAIYIAAISLIVSSTLSAYNKILVNTQASALIYVENLNCLESEFISTSVELTNFQELNNSCAYIDKGVYGGEKHAA